MTAPGSTASRLSRTQIAWRAAQDVPDGSYVNLGIGMPELVAGFVPAGREVTYHSENGILGFGAVVPGEEDADLINAGKKPIGLRPGASIVHQADSFAMIRGGHIDLALLGAFQIGANGDLANWRAGATGVPAVGGAMDLASGVRQVFVLTEHVTRAGEPKLVERCSYPLTGTGVVNRVFTDFAVVDIAPQGFVLREIVAGLSVAQLQAMTAAPLTLDGPPKLLAPPVD